MNDHPTSTERLTAAFRIEVPETTRLRHLAAIDEALLAAPAIVRTSRMVSLRRRIATVAAAFIVFAGPAAAIAAEASVPGDVLYPVKQLTERVRSVVDDDIAATHRVEELEVFVDRDEGAPQVQEAVRRAETAVAALDDGDELKMRLQQVMRRAQLQYGQELTPGTGPVVGDGPEQERTQQQPGQEGDGADHPGHGRSGDGGSGGGTGPGAGPGNGGGSVRP